MVARCKQIENIGSRLLSASKWKYALSPDDDEPTSGTSGAWNKHVVVNPVQSVRFVTVDGENKDGSRAIDDADTTLQENILKGAGTDEITPEVSVRLHQKCCNIGRYRCSVLSGSIGSESSCMLW